MLGAGSPVYYGLVCPARCWTLSSTNNEMLQATNRYFLSWESAWRGVISCCISVECMSIWREWFAKMNYSMFYNSNSLLHDLNSASSPNVNERTDIWIPRDVWRSLYFAFEFTIHLLKDVTFYVLITWCITQSVHTHPDATQITLK